MSGLVPKDHYRFEGSSLMEGLIQLHNKQRTSVVEETVNALNDLLLSHIQIDQANHSSIFHASQQGLIMPHEVIAMRAVLPQKI